MEGGDSSRRGGRSPRASRPRIPPSFRAIVPKCPSWRGSRLCGSSRDANTSTDPSESCPSGRESDLSTLTEDSRTSPSTGAFREVERRTLARVHARDAEGSGALSRVSMRSNRGSSGVLLRKGASTPDFDSTQTLFRLCRLGNAEELCALLESDQVGQEHLSSRDYNGRSLTLIATREGHVDCVKVLLECGADATVANNDGWTALHFAARGSPKKEEHSADWAEIIRALLLAGASLDARTSKGFLPLHYACASGHTDAVRLFLDHGASPFNASLHGATPLHLACFLGHIECARLIIDAAACVVAAEPSNAGRSQKRKLRRKSCFRAASRDSLHSADVKLVDAADLFGLTPLHCAVLRGRAHAASPRVDGAMRQSFHESLALLHLHSLADTHCRTSPTRDEDGVAMVALLLEHGANRLYPTFELGLTALHVALYLGHTEEARALLNPAAADMRAYEKAHGVRAAHIAACGEDTALLRQILLCDGESARFVDSTDDLGRTPLHIAVESRLADNVKVLLELGSSITAVDTQGRTPLMVAAGLLRLDLMCLLHHEDPAEVPHLTQEGSPLSGSPGSPERRSISMGRESFHESSRFSIFQTELSSATSCGNLSDVAEGHLLTDRRESLLARDFQGRDALMHAMEAGTRHDCVDVVRWLLRRGASVNECDEQGLTPLHLACRASHRKAESVLKKLLDVSADITARDRSGHTPLHVCASYGAEKPALQLLTRDTTMSKLLNVCDANGDTPLHLAVKAHQDKVVLLLVQHAAKILRNGEGLSPRDYSCSKRMHDMLQLEELRQGFELRYDMVLLLSWDDRLNAPPLGPPCIADLTRERDELDAAMDASVHRALVQAAVCVQRLVRGWSTRKMIAHMWRTQRAGLCKSLRGVLPDNKHHSPNINSPALQLQQILLALRRARIDYSVEKPFGASDKRVFVCLSCALSTLQDFAESINHKAQLRKFEPGLQEHLHRGTHTLPFASFQRRCADDFVPWRSRERALLLLQLLESREDCGAKLDLTRLTHKKVLADYFFLHQPYQRLEMYRAWVSQGEYPPLWPPELHARFISEGRQVVTPASTVTLSYLGERTTFFLMFISFYIAWLPVILPLGVAAVLWGQLGGLFLPGEQYHHREVVSIAFSFATMLWSFVMLAAWRRRSNLLAYRWGVTHFEEDDDRPLPQFVGTKRPNPVTGEQELWYSPAKRRLKIGVSGAISFVALVLVVCVQLVPKRFDSDVEEAFGISVLVFQLLQCMYTAVAVEAMGFVYTKVALRLTQWENHRTASAFARHMNLKVFLFGVINSNFSLVWIAFFDCGATCDFADYHKHENALGIQLTLLMLTRAATYVLTSIVVPLVRRNLALPENVNERVDKSVDMAVDKAIDKAGVNKGDASKPRVPLSGQLRLVCADALLARGRIDGFDDYMSIFVIQYGYSISFAAAMPMLSILSMVVGLLMLRATIFRLLYVQRRLTPRGSSGLGVWSDLLSMMTILAMGSNTVYAALLLRDSGMLSCPSSPLPSPPSCGEWSTSTLILGVLLLLVVLRLGINALTPEYPLWLQLLLVRARHFEQRGRKYEAQMLSAAMSTKRAERQRTERYSAAARFSSALRRTLWSLPACVVSASAALFHRKVDTLPQVRAYSLLAEESTLTPPFRRGKPIRTVVMPSRERSETSATAPPSDCPPPPDNVDPFFMPAAFLGPLVRRFGVVIGGITSLVEVL
ncbi:hypothetical protein AB1Y20_006964 [Prymnesium parvum]|uniref:Anoctamin transmembrane domain-containing protein n=1 Tax=Prymnesium parvum TaxID=97485 RepID=A0AB34J366_PRYPA